MTVAVEHLGAEYFQDPYSVHARLRAQRPVSPVIMPGGTPVWLAGHETTVNLIGNGVLALLLNPAELTRLRADPAPADRLNLGRDSSGHLAFGHGIHYCLGAPLARLEAEIAFSHLLARFGSIQLAVPAASLRWRPSTLIHGLESLPVRLVP